MNLTKKIFGLYLSGLIILAFQMTSCQKAEEAKEFEPPVGIWQVSNIDSNTGNTVGNDTITNTILENGNITLLISDSISVETISATVSKSVDNETAIFRITTHTTDNNAVGSYIKLRFSANGNTMSQYNYEGAASSGNAEGSNTVTMGPIVYTKQ
jgi:hypothetical protein